VTEATEVLVVYYRIIGDLGERLVYDYMCDYTKLNTDTEASAEEATRVAPSGAKRARQTASTWSVMVCAHARVDKSQSLMEQSLDVVTMAFDDVGLVVTLSTQDV